MARDDYYVIVYQILSYLYDCLKKGKSVEADSLTPDGELFAINEKYWKYIMINMRDQGFIRGIVIKEEGNELQIKRLNHCEITPDGIDYLCDNSRIKRAYDFAKDVLSIVPIKL